MRRTPIRMKLAAALSVPLIGLLLVTVVEIVDTTREADEIRTQTELARATTGPSGVITALQNERTWAVTELIGQETVVQPPVVGYDQTRAETDRAITAFRSALEEQGAEAVEAYRPALDALDGLAGVRGLIDESTAPRTLDNVGLSDEVYSGYADLIRPFLDANTRVALAIDDTELREATSLVDTTTRQIDAIADLARSSILEIVLGGGFDGSVEIAEVSQLRATFDEANQELLEASAPYDEIVDALYPAELVESFSAQLDNALAGEEVAFDELMATLDVPADAGYMGLRDGLVRGLDARADELNDAAQARERLFVALAVATLTAAVALSWLVSRSITVPLRSLTRQAKDMAQHRLPNAVADILETPLGEDIAVPQVEPVRVRTRDEVSDVADALNTVQDTALDLAVEQAVLRRNIADSFVNLGRRNQNLLGRQLDFITELESNESDPDTLSNLFRLDHLATRMRRNAESLLVLAGFEPPRQWAAPVRLTDVIRAALGEVEDYQRVTVRGVEPATILGSAAADLAHLMAELIENALVFSPPDQAVEIRGRHRSDGFGADGGYTLAIIDSGLGMPAADIAAANRRLAGAESFTIAPSKYLGHYVAGNLAARHNINVRLESSPSSGVTATITLPRTLLTDEPVTGAPVTPPGGHRVLPPPARPLPPAAPPPVPAAGGRSEPSSPLWSTPWVAPVGDAPSPPVPPSATPRPRPPARPSAHPNAAPAAFQPADHLTGGVPERPAAPSGSPAWSAPAHATGALPPRGPAAAPEATPRHTPSRPTGGGMWGRPGALAGGPRATDDMPPPTSTTARGLPRRTATPAAPTAAPRPVDDDLLAALGRHVPARPPADGADRDAAPPLPSRERRAPSPGRPRDDTGPVPPITRPARPAPPASGAPRGPAPTPTAGSGGSTSPAGGHDSPLTPPDALTRRVKGAQLPRTALISVRRGGADLPEAPAGPPPGRAPAPPADPMSTSSRASDVQSLLTSFTAGVQRGLDDARDLQRRNSGQVQVIDAPPPGGPHG